MKLTNQEIKARIESQGIRDTVFYLRKNVTGTFLQTVCLLCEVLGAKATNDLIAQSDWE